MFDVNHYVPALKAKKGEYDALAGLDEKTRSFITPLIEVVPVPWDYTEDAPTKTLAQHLDRDCRMMVECWGCDAPLFLELDNAVDEPAVIDSGDHPVQWTHSRLASMGVAAVPVTGLGRSVAYNEAVADVVAGHQLGLCLRLRPEEFTDPAALGANVTAFLTEVGLEPSQVDLVIDNASIEPSTGLHLLLARSELDALPALDQWRSLTLLQSAFPENLSSVAPQSRHRLERTEWLVWRALADQFGSLPRLPTFGDYAIDGPRFVEGDPRLLQMSANVRYTSEEYWLILKGVTIKRNGFGQYHKLAQDLVTSCPEWCGPDFSPGDAYIAACARHVDGPGNASTWRRVGTSHHLSFVAEQVARTVGI